MSTSSCFISTRFHHHIRTVIIRENMLCWVQAGFKTLLPSLGEQHTYSSGQLLLLTRGSQWDVINKPAHNGFYQALVLQIATDTINAFHQRYAHVFPVSAIEQHAMITPTETLRQALQHSHGLLNDAAHSNVFQEHQIQAVLLLLAEQGVVFPVSKALSWSDKVRQLISSCPEAVWSIEHIAEQFHTSPSTLRRRIADTGTTLGDLIRDIRLETGLMLLQTSELPIGDIAAHCGYESHSRFSAAFKQRFGFSPSHLRANTLLNGLA